MTPQQYEKLTALEEQLGETKAEIVRNALRQFCYTAEVALAGGSFQAVDKKGRTTDVVILELT